MSERYPRYDVLAKRRTPSWNEVTRQAIDARLAVPPGPRFFDAAEWLTLKAVCARILPQPAGPAPVALAAYVDVKMATDARDGYRMAELPPQREAWRQGLAAIEAEAQRRYGRAFHEMAGELQDALLSDVQDGKVEGSGWRGLPPHVFFAERVLADVTRAYYAHPTAWSEMGWGDQASPRGYVRMGFDERDPWEAAEAGRRQSAAVAARENRRVGDR